MSIDLSALSPEACEAYIVVGRLFGSPDTTAQGARLADARVALAGADRIGAVGNKKITNATLGAALQEGKSQRESARSILENTQRSLVEAGGAAATAGAKVS
ncbi:Hypothetical protein A7982_03314 [Minicystis rosea]|nr:Hypothetical protein A7982_03314 [Minicystis rosea]